jgi:hypothetical protein
VTEADVRPTPFIRTVSFGAANLDTRKRSGTEDTTAQGNNNIIASVARPGDRCAPDTPAIFDDYYKLEKKRKRRKVKREPDEEASLMSLQARA